ncbi:hypothetical protein AVEN_8744-1 [Araneus ventricosus]|uniref:Uncharacterized protein n=1 Tax=Araneus ventricosus TaxID=182803 RepID=A0A4Y2LVQ6_ARAVE|nr:hypothetical protein AVEN_8744-1 [Araneus ventricosus]
MSLEEEDIEKGSGDSNQANEMFNPRDYPAYFTPYNATAVKLGIARVSASCLNRRRKVAQKNSGTTQSSSSKRKNSADKEPAKRPKKD